MRKLLVKFCDFLEKKLYNEPTFRELSSVLEKTQYRLYEANKENARLKHLIKLIDDR